jgi:hypothetical protein
MNQRAVRAGVGAFNAISRHLFTDMESNFFRLHKACRSNSLTSVERMYALYKAVEYLAENGIEGDFVECGVWRGGSTMMACLSLVELGDTERRVWLYDTFEGMTEPTRKDSVSPLRGRRLLPDPGSMVDRWFLDGLAVTADEVRANLSSTGYPTERLIFVQGKVEDTLPKSVPDRIALLRLDTDWYESTYHELVHLFPRLVPGGVLILDDYGHLEGAREAVDQYFGEQGVKMLLNRIDFTGRIGIKTA